MSWMVIKRMLVTGWKNFARGGAVSAATVVIMTVTLFIIGSLLFLSALLTFTLTSIKNKVDIPIYFVTTATEADILAVKKQVEKLPQVAVVTYTSAVDALAAFRERHANDQLTLQALEELGGNPLEASLSIRAKDPSEYESIVNFLEASPTLSAGGTSIIDSIGYSDTGPGKNKKDVIDRLTAVLGATRQIGLAIFALFAIASILIAFATIRLAIFTAKDEIAVMRLVGASNAYVQGPFVVTGVITGVLAAAMVLLLLWPATWYVGQKTVGWFEGFNVATYYRGHFPLIFVILMGAGFLLGALASVLAINKYLKA